MKKAKKQKLPFFLRYIKQHLIVFIYIFLFNFLFFPMPTLANYAVLEAKDYDSLVSLAKNRGVELIGVNHLPENDDSEVDYTIFRILTSYNSEVGQCDDTPCQTANMFDICEHSIEDTIAANFLKLGTKVKIPDLFGDRVFIVRDRMNKRYQDRVDIWMRNKQDSKDFGVKYAKIEVLK